MIHAYQMNGLNIVLDIDSASVHIVDEVAYALIKFIDENADRNAASEAVISKFSVSPEDVREALDEIDALIESGALFSENRYEEVQKKAQTATPFLKALCLHVAHTCNLSCDYCFASQGRYHGERGLMSFEVGKRALDFLIEQSGSHYHLEVDFFGGEPLMNLDVVKALVAYAREAEQARSKRFRFTLTTNGVLLNDEVAEFLNREMDNVVLSLDGRKEVNDRLRRTASGQGSYDLIVPKFQSFVKKRGDKGYYMRGTFTHENLDFSRDVLHMVDLGFTQLSMEPVVGGGPSALTEEDLPFLMNEYEKLAQEMARRHKEGKGFTFYHYMLDLKNGPCIYKRIMGCGSGSEYLAVTPDGELYPCHQFVGHPDFRMGDVFGGVTRPEIGEAFLRENIFTRPKCKACWGRLYCSGGCAANAYNAQGTVGGVYEYGCKLFLKRIECAIMLEAMKALDA